MRNKARNHNPKSLSRAIDNCFYGTGHGRYSSCGKWEIGLGGYDMGYQVYCNNIAICEIKSDNRVVMLSDEDLTIRRTGHTPLQIFNAIKEVESCVVLAQDED